MLQLWVDQADEKSVTTCALSGGAFEVNHYTPYFHAE
jgi:hypothetical protein